MISAKLIIDLLDTPLLFVDWYDSSESHANKKTTYCPELPKNNGLTYFDKQWKNIFGLSIKLYILYRINFI
ncbi:hypothetical protein AB204_06850 [Xenorhabdus khoisanae]|uniref:Uncharacterized protein n=1 Tax=Xenorhabdus khoisanae TaxID=880157 RepID=A0A0J5IRJ5_9GAMM|nr:hypothetical protein AB204_06850 [Xenorhabdus khoisanae]